MPTVKRALPASCLAQAMCTGQMTTLTHEHSPAALTNTSSCHMNHMASAPCHLGVWTTSKLLQAANYMPCIPCRQRHHASVPAAASPPFSCWSLAAANALSLSMSRRSRRRRLFGPAPCTAHTSGHHSVCCLLQPVTQCSCTPCTHSSNGHSRVHSRAAHAGGNKPHLVCHIHRPHEPLKVVALLLLLLLLLLPLHPELQGCPHSVGQHSRRDNLPLARVWRHHSAHASRAVGDTDTNPQQQAWLLKSHWVRL